MYLHIDVPANMHIWTSMFANAYIIAIKKLIVLGGEQCWIAIQRAGPRLSNLEYVLRERWLRNKLQLMRFRIRDSKWTRTRAEFSNLRIYADRTSIRIPASKIFASSESVSSTCKDHCTEKMHSANLSFSVNLIITLSTSETLARTSLECNGISKRVFNHSPPAYSLHCPHWMHSWTSIWTNTHNTGTHCMKCMSISETFWCCNLSIIERAINPTISFYQPTHNEQTTWHCRCFVATKDSVTNWNGLLEYKRVWLAIRNCCEKKDEFVN